MNYEEEIKIDPSALDVEWLEQPQKLLSYGKYMNHCRLVLEQQEEIMKVYKAELDLKIREDPETYSISKITETAIASAILISPKHKEISEKIRQANFDYQMAKIVFDSFNQRKDALENLVRLHGQQYFAGPRLPRNLDEEWIEKTRKKQTDIKINKIINKKT